MGKPGRDGAPSPVNAGDSATRQVRRDGPPTRSRRGGYHLARPGGPPGPKGVQYRRNQTSNSNLVWVGLVCVVGGSSPLLAESLVCGSPPLLAGFGCRWWSVVPPHSWLWVMVAVPQHSWLGCTGCGGVAGLFHGGGVGGIPCCVCLWRGRLRVVLVLLCVLCVCGVFVGCGVVWVCPPRALVCVRACLWCVGGLWLLVPAPLSWGLRLVFVWVWLVCVVLAPSPLLAGVRRLW